jgi:phosphatidylglycerol---prolipoprotein diacylglyceryl transferase
VFPQLFHLGNFFLPTYGVLVALGLISGLLWISRLAPRNGVDPDHAWNLGIYVILAGIVGAKILLIVVDWHFYMQHPREIFSLGTLQAGGVFSGGVAGAVLVGTWYARLRKMPWLKTVDVFAPGLALGHAIGRLGCFAAGCCYGRETSVPWAVTFTNPIANRLVGTPLNVHLHPTQIYESLVEIANFALLSWLFRHKRFDGQVMGTYLFSYGIARFFLEFLRGDPGRGQFFNTWMTTTQFIAICMVAGGGVLWMNLAGRQQQRVVAAASS